VLASTDRLGEVKVSKRRVRHIVGEEVVADRGLIAQRELPLRQLRDLAADEVQVAHRDDRPPGPRRSRTRAKTAS
jgi:hypothetical protein